MNQHKPPQAMTLFDLIARRWELDGAVRQVRFNASGTSLAAILEDGRMAFVSVKDLEDPESRVRIEADTGRTSIRPRAKPLPVPVVTKTPVAQADVAMCRLGAQGFAFAQLETGALWRATARGQTLAVKHAGDSVVTALADAPQTGQIVRACGYELTLMGKDDGAEIASVELTHDISRIAFSADGRLLGCFGSGQMSIVTVDGFKAGSVIACEGGDVLDLAWSPCARWLVAGCRDKALLLVDVTAGTSDRIVDFPDAVRAVDFSTEAGAMIAAGAFRVAGWTLPDLPFGDHEGAPIETGKPGLMVVDLVAAHPTRDLCAVSYANGLVLVCRVAHPDEMLLREGTGARAQALAWTDDGAHLAIGDADGGLSIATFPKNMFK
ncbi:MAG: hypothetical protein R8G34_15885 [Paracoccaceae bacterium]|nr:hypothetical protein [Paracoccaceae bacterium]